LFAVQFVLTCGVALVTSVLTVYLRDLKGIVAVGLTLLFYLTPVFYSREIVPERFRFVLDLNPMATIIASYRALLLDAPGPGAASVAALGVLSVAMAVVGYRVYVRLAPHFPDRL
jgi:ABC-type polysaccharide/polyol phosphate export permease